ncbi:MAG: hypothetical protein ACXWBO_01820, partial [Ilumatobacteraceae bacterium]
SEWIDQNAATQYEPVIAWGRPMSIDTRFGSPEQTPDGPPRRLADIRRQLINRYPAVGPIFA